MGALTWWLSLCLPSLPRRPPPRRGRHRLPCRGRIRTAGPDPRPRVSWHRTGPLPVCARCYTALLPFTSPLPDDYEPRLLPTDWELREQLADQQVRAQLALTEQWLDAELVVGEAEHAAAGRRRLVLLHGLSAHQQTDVEELFAFVDRICHAHGLTLYGEVHTSRYLAEHRTAATRWTSPHPTPTPPYNSSATPSPRTTPTGRSKPKTTDLSEGPSTCSTQT